MSSDSEKLSKPMKRHWRITSESDSDDTLKNNNIRRKSVCRVLSDDETTDDDSDIPLQPIQKKKNQKLVSEDESYSSSCNDGAESYFSGDSTSSQWESDWESMEESDNESNKSNCTKKCKKLQNKTIDKNKSVSMQDSEMSDGESENCPICLLSFRKQEVASPASCEHCFCLDCLIEWSKNINTCPVDRQTFTSINVRSKIGGQITRHIPVEAKSLEELPPEDPTFCEVCQLSDREDRMLLCDGCDCGYHLECLDPPLDEVPLEEQWYCSECSANVTNDAEAIDIDLDELPDLMQEARELGLIYGRRRANVLTQSNALSQSSGRRSLMLPRTRQTERVRANVRRNRNSATVVAAAAAASRERNRPTTSTSSGFDSISENSRSRSPVPGPSFFGSSSRRTAAAGARKKTKKQPSRASAKRKYTKKKKKLTCKAGAITTREVRSHRINENGDYVEIVTSVTVPSLSTRSRSRGPVPPGRRKKRKKQRRVRTVASVAAAKKTAKRRIAAQLKIVKSLRFTGDATPLIPIVKSELGAAHPNMALRLAHNQAGISQLSLFGNDLGLGYSPPGFWKIEAG